MSVFYNASANSGGAAAVNTSTSAVKVLTNTLTAGATTLTFTDSKITDDAIIDIYTSNYGVSPTGGSQNGTTLTLTFDAQESDLKVRAVILDPDGTILVDNSVDTSVLTATLTAGEATLSFTDSLITDDSIINVYTSDYNVKPVSAVQNGNAFTLTFDKQESDLNVKLLIFDGKAQTGTTGGSATVVTGGTSDYEKLSNLPTINGVTLKGNLTSDDLSIVTSSGSGNTILKKTLTAGKTSLTFTDDAIDDEAVIGVYTSSYGVSPTGGSQSGNTITLTFDTQTSDLNVKVIIFGEGESSSTNKKTYTTTETAIGTWIDGKTIYRKVYNVTSGVTENVITPIIDDLPSIDALINLYGYIVGINNRKLVLNTPYISSSDSIIDAGGIRVFINLNNKISEIHTSSNENGCEMYIIIEYTKTT